MFGSSNDKAFGMTPKVGNSIPLLRPLGRDIFCLKILDPSGFGTPPHIAGPFYANSPVISGFPYNTKGSNAEH